MIYKGNYYPDYIWLNKIHTDNNCNKLGSSVANFIIGNRQAGKTVGVGIFALADFLCYGYQSALIGRVEIDFSDRKIMESFWNKSKNFVKEFPEVVKNSPELMKLYPTEVLAAVDWEKVDLTYKEHQAYVNGKLFCYKIVINQFNHNKSNYFENVHNILYDEFIAEDGSQISNEVNAVYNIYDSVARSRDDALYSTAIIFMSNSVTLENQYFVELGIDKLIRSNTKRLLRKEQSFSVEIVNNKIVSDKIEESPFGKLLSAGKVGKKYLGYAQDNCVLDNANFVLPNINLSNANYDCTIIYEGKMFAVYIIDNGKYYFTTKSVQKTCVRKFSVKINDHDLTDRMDRIQLSKYKVAFTDGLLYFNSQLSKNVFVDMLRFI